MTNYYRPLFELASRVSPPGFLCSIGAAEILTNPNSEALRALLVEDLKQVLLRLHAPRTWEELHGEERLQRRRAIRLAVVVAATLAVLLVAAVFAGSWAVRNRNGIVATVGQVQLRQIAADLSREDAEQKQVLAQASRKAALRQYENAEHQRITAIEQRNIAIARQLAAQAEAIQSENAVDLQPAALLAIESMKLFPNVEADRALRESMALLPREVLHLRDGHQMTIALSPDGTKVLIGRAGTSRIIATSDGSLICRLAGSPDTISGAFSADGRLIAVSGRDDAVHVFDSRTGERVSVFKFSEPIDSMAFGPTGALAVVTRRGLVGFDAVTGKEISSLKQDGAACVAFGNEGKLIATCSTDGTVRVFDSALGREISSLKHQGAVLAITFASKGGLVATGSEDGTARIFDAASGKQLNQINHDYDVHSVAFSPDANYLVTGSGALADRKGVAKLVEVKSGKELLRINHAGPVHAVALQRRWAVLYHRQRHAHTFHRNGRIARLSHVWWEGTSPLISSGCRH